MAENLQSSQPTYHPQVKIECTTCETVYEAGSTATAIKVDTCAHCHPFYTGKQQFGHAKGRVEKFKTKLSHKQTEKPVKAKSKAKPKAKPTAQVFNNPADLAKLNLAAADKKAKPKTKPESSPADSTKD